MKQDCRIYFVIVAGLGLTGFCAERTYPIVGTGQTRCYDNCSAIAPPVRGQPFYGQDAQHPGLLAHYRDNGDGTISDLNTGLMWVKARGERSTWDAAIAGAAACRIGQHNDWRAPTIKELYSLINFAGGFHLHAADSQPYLDTTYFEFKYGAESKGERGIACQDWSATEYTGATMDGKVEAAFSNPTVFGVNFADGRIKGYPKTMRRRDGDTVNRTYVRYVRGNLQYGKNDFHDNADGTITDRATGLMWTKTDSGRGLNWEQALAYAGNLKLAGHADWRLPNAKELQSIVDYTRIPAINPLFQLSTLPDHNHPFYWTSTTHLDGPPDRQGSAVYVSFGRALGWMQFPPGVGEYRLLDVHGAGAQRSDPKTGNPADFPHGRGPQGDVIRIYNYVRLVRGGSDCGVDRWQRGQ